MKIFVLAPTYPHPGHPFSGVFNERSAIALSELCDGVEVLAPRPYAPPLISSWSSRWKMHSLTPAFEVRNTIRVHRPAYPQTPKIGGAFWVDSAAFRFSRAVARRIHNRVRFDAILSFDLVGSGGLAWRTGQDLSIPTAGWATGGDLNSPSSSSHSQAVCRALRKLDIVFYQSQALLEKAASLLGAVTSELSPERHIVLSRGITLPCQPSNDVRKRVRSELGITEKQVLVLNVGRICREKGVFELIDAVSLAADKDPRIKCVLLGSHPAFDETIAVRKHLEKLHATKDRVSLLPACMPDRVWEYLWAADIFAFSSHNEGMPNSLLEAMAIGVPCVAFAIPAAREIEAGTGALLLVPLGDSKGLAEAILRLAASPTERSRLGEKAKHRVRERFMMKANMAEAVRRLGMTRKPNEALSARALA